MSRTLALKTSSILICFIILAAAAFTVFAEESTPSTNVRKPAVIKQKINIREDKVDSKIAALQEKQASRTAALKARLEKFKDRRKAEIAERVNTNLNKINQNQTGQMQRHLELMSKLLDKLEAKVAVNEAITSSRATIATVSAAISAQSEKDYTIAVSSETRVRTDAKTQRDKLHKDLLAVRKMVIDAKQSVANTIRVAKSTPSTSSGLTKEATNGGQQ